MPATNVVSLDEFMNSGGFESNPKVVSLDEFMSDEKDHFENRFQSEIMALTPERKAQLREPTPQEEKAMQLARDVKLAKEYPNDYYSGVSAPMEAFAQGVLPIRPKDISRPGVEEAYPVAKAVGSLAGMLTTGVLTAGIAPTVTFLKQLASLPTLAKFAAGKMAQTGATFGLKELADNMAEIVRGDKKSFQEVLGKTAEATALGTGLGAVGTIPQPLLRIPAEAAYGFSTAKMMGANNFEAGVNGAIYGVFGMLNSANLVNEYKIAAFNAGKQAMVERLTSKGLDLESAQVVADRYFNWAINRAGGWGETKIDDFDKFSQAMRKGWKIFVEPEIKPEASGNTPIGLHQLQGGAIKPEELSIYNNNLIELKSGVSKQAHISDLPIEIASQRKIPRSIYIDQKMIDKIENTHKLPVDVNFINNLNSADELVFPIDEPDKINFIKKLGEDNYLVVATRRFNGHFIVTGFTSEKGSYIDNIKERGEVISLAGKTPISSIASTLTGQRQPERLSGVNKTTSPEQSILQEGVKVKDKFEGLYQKVVNRFQSIENTVNKAKELGAEIKPGEDAALSAERYLSIGNQAKNTLEQGTYRITREGSIVKTGEGLKPVIDNYDKISPELNSEIKDKELTEYLLAKRTIEDLQRPKSEFNQEKIASPEQVEEAQNVLDNIKNKYDGNIKHLEDTANRLYDYQKRVLHLLVDSGNMSQEMYNSIIVRNPHYVPFDRIIPTEEIAVGTPVNKNRFSGARSPVKKIKGSELEIHDPIESMIKNTYRIMDIASRNKVFNDIFSLKDIPEIEIKEVKAPIVPVANIKVNSAIDADYIRQVKEFAEKLGAKVQTGGQPGQTLGTYSPTGKVVERKFSTPGEVISHEVGHFLDDKYKLRDKFYRKGESKEVGDEIKQFMIDQGQSPNRVNKVSERFAHAFEWWLSNRALAKEDLPLFSVKIEKIISEIPELKPLLAIRPKPGLSIESRQETIFAPSQFKPKGNVLEGYIDGKRIYIEVSKNLYDAMTGLTETSSNMIVEILSKPTQWLRTGATTTPEFILRNPIRDQWTALIQTSLGWKPFIDTGSAIADICKKDDIYNDWIRAGGSYAGFVELSRPRLAKMVEELKGNKSLLANLNILTKLSDISQLMEQGTRLGVYKAGIKKGLSPIEAAKQSRESTVDFARRGSSTKDINACIAFFNAGIQGLDKTARNAKQDPVGMTIKSVVSITIPSLLLYLKNRQDDDYKEIPRWQKDLFWMTKIGNTWIRIPKPFLYGQMFGSIPERFMEYLDTKDSKALTTYGKSLYNALSPVSDDPMSGLLPTAIKPLLENKTNWSFFRERPIVSESKQRLLPPEQYNKYDSETAKLLGKIFNVSPSKIENLIQGYAGGMGKYAEQWVGDPILDAITKMQGKDSKAKKPMELSDIPLIKGFVSRDITSGQSESVQQFYDNREKVSQLYSTYRNFVKTGENERANQLRGSHPEMRYYSRFNQYAERFSDIEKQVDRIVESKGLNDSEKRERIKNLELKKIDLAKRANDLLK